jgi:hypothetical protein
VKQERRYPLRLDAYAGRYVPVPAAAKLSEAEKVALEGLLRKKGAVANRSVGVRVNGSGRLP